MTITVIAEQDSEAAKKMRVDNKDGVRTWKVTGTFEEDAAFTALAIEVPETIEVDGDTLYLDKIKVKNNQADVWDGTAWYISEEEKNEQEEKQKQKNPGPEWEFDTTGGTRHITSSYKTTQYGEFGAGGEVTTRYANAINVKRTKTGFDVKGCEKIVPSLEATVTFPVPPGTIGLGWIMDVARATGKTNATAWKDFLPGEALFKGGRIKLKRYDKTVVAYTFKLSENITVQHNIKVGDIGPFEAGGHDYVWVEYENVDKTDSDGNLQIFPKARYLFVEEIYRKTSFDFLGIP